MIVYEAPGQTIHVDWVNTGTMLRVASTTAPDAFCSTPAGALEHAATVAGVKRLSSLWIWRLCAERDNPSKPQPRLVDVTGVHR